MGFFAHAFDIRRTDTTWEVLMVFRFGPIVKFLANQDGK
jgi:hypothetical protein